MYVNGSVPWPWAPSMSAGGCYVACADSSSLFGVTMCAQALESVCNSRLFASTPSLKRTPEGEVSKVSVHHGRVGVVVGLY